MGFMGVLWYNLVDTPDFPVLFHVFACLSMNNMSMFVHSNVSNPCHQEQRESGDHDNPG